MRLNYHWPVWYFFRQLVKRGANKELFKGSLTSRKINICVFAQVGRRGFVSNKMKSLNQEITVIMCLIPNCRIR